VIDPVMLERVLSHIHNWFERGTSSVAGVSEGSLTPGPDVPSGAWYRLQGSLLNDGLHLHPADDLVDEEFNGTVTVLAIPRPLLQVVDEISQWVADTAGAEEFARKAKFQSESFGGYSYTLRGDLNASQSADGRSLSGWRAKFAQDLNPWRRIS